MTTIPGVTLTGAYNLPWARCLQIEAIDLIPEGTEVTPPPIFHLVSAFVKHLPHLWAEGCRPLLKRRPPAPAVRPHYLELWNMASRDWIKNDHIMKDVPSPLIHDGTIIVYPYQCTEAFQDPSLYRVAMQEAASIYNWCQHFCPSICLPHFFAAALWLHRCRLKLNLHLR